MKTELSTWVLGLMLAMGFGAGAHAQEVPLPPSALPPQPQGTNTAKPYTSFWLSEVLKLAQAGLAEDVMLSYIDNSPGTFNLGADHIIALRNFGVSGDVINAMIQHDADVKSGRRKVPASTIPTSEPLLPIAVSPKTATNSATATAVGQAPTTPAVQIVVDEPEAAFAESWEPEPGTAAPVVVAKSCIPARRPYVQGLDTKPVYRVREPYPVKLTDPILVYRAEVRPPNLQVLQVFPEQKP